MTRMLWLGLLSGCGGMTPVVAADPVEDQVLDSGSWDTGGEGDSDADADTDTDSDTDTDVDTGFDSSDRNGNYTGTFAFTAEEASMGMSDTCSGTLYLTVDTDAEPGIDGYSDCEFTMAGITTFLLSGDEDIDPAVSGQLVGSFFSTGIAWDGSFEGNILTGSMAGSSVVDTYNITYSGSFTAAK